MANIVWTKTFQAGTTLPASDLEQLKTDITSVVNGGLEEANLNPAAVLGASKIDDHSDDAATMKAVTNPGTPGSESLATTLEAELQRLRYILARIQFGNASDQGGALEWYERSPNLLSLPMNMLDNGSFEIPFTAGVTAPPGWDETGTAAAAYTHEQNAAALGLGRGYRLKITGHGATANTGVVKVLAANGLRPSTTYLVYAIAWADAGDTARITVTTGGGTDMDVETASTTPVMLHGFFTTTNVPDACTISFVAKAATDVVYFDHCLLVPVVTTPRDSGYVSSYLQLENAGTVIGNVAGHVAEIGATGAAPNANFQNFTDGSQNLQASIVCPGHGYKLKVTAKAGFKCDGSEEPAHLILAESTDGGASFVIRDGGEVGPATENPNTGRHILLQHYNDSPTPGNTYLFKVMGAVGAATHSFTPQGANAGAATHTKSFIHVEMIPGGR